ncbi:MAG: Gfo/Idh/MocA family oxidoreductase [Anaerolineae bacterium]|nr:Gfo/Idh/MocA family oxidoreductase [Anaerolineae bacterium]
MAQHVDAVLVGCGGISRAWLEASAQVPGLRIAGLVDIAREAAEARAAQFGLDEALIDSDLGAVLDQLEPDVVFNCTVPEAHQAVTLAALARGCHVLSEKPLADSMDSAREIVAAAAEADRLFAVIQNRRYQAGIRRLSRTLRAGTIGRVTTVNSDFYIGAHFGGFRDRMEHVLLLDMAIHTFDAARLIADADPVAVYCKEWNPPGSWYDHDASAVAVFEMSGGLVYTYRGSWCAEGVNTSWECDWRVVGERGTVTWDGGDGFAAQVVAKTGGFRSEWRDVAIPPLDAGDRIGGHGGQIADFVDCVRTGRVPETVGSDNIRSLAMVFGAIESAGQGCSVPVTW